MNTTVFCYAVGTTLDQIISNIPDEWVKTYNDRYIYAYRNTGKDAFAVFACDDDRVIRTCDVKIKRKGRYESIFLYSGLFDHLTSYRDIRIDEDIMHKIKQTTDNDFPVYTLLDRKNALRRFYKRMNDKPVYNSVPIRNDKSQWRTVADPEGDTCTDFIIIPDKWVNIWGTDREGEAWDEIEEFIFSTVGYKSGYDFPTGQMITLSWAFTRTPSGIAIKHRRGIDW